MGRDGGRRNDGLKPLFWQNDKHESKVISARSIYRLIYAWHRTITRPTAISRFALVFYNPVNSREDDAASRNSSILENSLRILSPDSLSLLSNYRFLADPPPSRIQHASHAFYFPYIFLSPFPSKSPLFPLNRYVPRFTSRPTSATLLATVATQLLPHPSSIRVVAIAAETTVIRLRTAAHPRLRRRRRASPPPPLILLPPFLRLFVRLFADATKAADPVEKFQSKSGRGAESNVLERNVRVGRFDRRPGAI